MKKLTSIALIFSAISLSNCTFYDEEDTVIIGYLKLNDLLENKIKNTYKKDIEDFHTSYENYQNSKRAYNLFSYRGSNWYSDLAYEEMSKFDYEMDNINAFYNHYFENQKIKIDDLHNAISIELWNYLKKNYSDAIPSKAQNTQEGRFFTINELREKYPDYKELEIENFSPMELINSVMNEKLFETSFYADGDVNLKTLYSFYLQNKPKEENASDKKSNSKKDVNFLEIEGFKIHIPKDFEKHKRMKNTYMLPNHDGGEATYFSYEILADAKSPYDLYPEACNADYSSTDTELFVTKEGENGANTIWREYKVNEKWCLLTMVFNENVMSSKNVYEILNKSK